MISADDPEQADEAGRVLSAAAARAGLGGDFDALLFLKRDDDMAFINGLDPGWSGALPATFVYDGSGRRTRAWRSPITYQDLQSGIGAALAAAPPLTDRRARDKTGVATTDGPTGDKSQTKSKPKGQTKSPITTPRRQP
jgi:hypothetical protein